MVPCVKAMVALVLAFLISLPSMVAYAGNMYQDVDVTWGDGRGKILNNGQLLTLSLDRASGSGFQSKNQYLFGKIDMQIKLVPANSAGTVTAFYVSSLDQYLNSSDSITIQNSSINFLNTPQHTHTYSYCMFMMLN